MVGRDWSLRRSLPFTTRHDGNQRNPWQWSTWQASGYLHNRGRAPKSTSLLTELLLPCAIILLPSAALAALLLYFVLGKQLHPPHFTNPDLAFPLASTSPSYYYVDFSTSKLSTIVSKFATAASLATSSALLLLSWPISKSIFKYSCQGRHDKLPTPFQLSLLIGVFNDGGVGDVFKYLRYHFTYKGGRAKVPGLLTMAVSVLIFLILLQYTMMGFEIWFSSALSTVSWVRVHDSIPSFAGGVGLSSWCLNNMVAPGDYIDRERQCTVYTNSKDRNTGLNNASVAYAILDKASTQYNLRNAQDSLMLPVPPVAPNIDYTASSFAVKTQCKPIATACHTLIDGTYNCTSAGFAFAGDVSTLASQGNVFKHSSLALSFTELAYAGPQGLNCTYPNCLNQTNTAVKGHFALVATIEFAYDWTPGNDFSTSQVYPISGAEGSAFFLLGCDYYAYDVQYSWVGGSNPAGDIRILNTSPLNYSTFHNLNYPLQQKLGDTFLRNQLNSIVAMETDHSIITVADKFSAAFSTAFLALSAGALGSRTAISQQDRDTISVAKVPKILFWVNVALPLAFASIGLLIAFWAFLSHRGDSGGKDIRESMSLAGLIAQRYIPQPEESEAKSVEELFQQSEQYGAEHKVVAAQNRSGTWELRPKCEL